MTVARNRAVDVLRRTTVERRKLAELAALAVAAAPDEPAVLYLLFTKGYGGDGEPAVADEAIRLARLLAELMLGPGRDRRGHRHPRAPPTTPGPTCCRPGSPHATRPPAGPADTDWLRIADCYDALVRLAPSPVIELNAPSRTGTPTGRPPASRCAPPRAPAGRSTTGPRRRALRPSTSRSWAGPAW
jgi:RNA polymerase sigma-70 factor (ECF subfamily)